MTHLAKRLGWFAVGAALLCAVVFGYRRLHALEQLPPSHMEPLDAARMHAAMLEAGQLEQRLQPLYKLIQEQGDKYKLDRNQQGQLTDVIDWETGEIHRPTAQPHK